MVGGALHVICLEVGDGRQIWVCCLAVVAFVEVVGKDLPVEVAFHGVRVIEVIIVKIELLESLLLVGTFELLVPRYLRNFVRVHVDVNEAVGVNVNVDWEEAVFGLVEAFKILVARGLRQLAIQTIRPSMVFAREDLRVALLLLDDGVGSVSANIVEGVDLAIAVLRDNKVVVGTVVAQPITRLLKTRLVCEDQPSARENGAPLELVHFL